MKKFIISLIFIQFSSISYAQEVDVVTIKKGEPAPFSGTLMTPNAIAKILAEKEFDKKKCDLDSQYSLLKMRAQCDLDIGKIKIDLDIANKTHDAIVRIKDDEIKKLNQMVIKENSKSERWIYWLAGGILSGIALTVGVTYSVNR